MTFAPELGITPAEATRLSSGVYYRDLVRGTGAGAVPDRDIVFRYVAYLPDGRQVSGGMTDPPVTVKLTRDNLIRGWYDGIQGMRAGGLRKLIIPPELGYGARARGAIPPNSILVFDIELLAVR